MMKIKINYFFFILTIVLPIGLATITIPIFWWWIDNPYGNIILSPFWTVIGLYVLGFALAGLAVGYPGVPWLAVIREDRITFHRLFRRRLIIMYKDVKRLEILSKQLPVGENLRGLGNLVFTTKDGNKYVVLAVPHYISMELKRMLGDRVGEYYRKITDEEFDKYAVGKKK